MRPILPCCTHIGAYGSHKLFMCMLAGIIALCNVIFIGAENEHVLLLHSLIHYQHLEKLDRLLDWFLVVHVILSDYNHFLRIFAILEFFSHYSASR